MATPNYNYEKRQRELAKKKKKEEKLKERESRKVEGDTPNQNEGSAHVEDSAGVAQAGITGASNGAPHSS